MNDTQDDLFYPNGIDGSTGEPLLPPLSAAQIGAFARNESLDSEHLKQLREWLEKRTQRTWGPMSKINHKDLAQTGWGVIFARGTTDDIVEALQPLLELRREQAGERYREFRGDSAPAPEQSKSLFLAPYDIGPGPVDPKIIPYYLLLVGSPDDISYEFQYQLDVQFAVGRLHFDGPDYLTQFATYAKNVVAASKSVTCSRRAAFFGTNHDRATQGSATLFLDPLSKKFERNHPDWKVKCTIGPDATKDNLARVLGGDQTPDLLITATHGLGFSVDSEKQYTEQGAILCQDWPDKNTLTRHVQRNHYFCAEDVNDNFNLSGLIALHFACYSAGTPKRDDFADQLLEDPPLLAPKNFVARLPQRLLGKESGALAVIGHVDRAWGFSFCWPETKGQTTVFESALDSLVAGYPVGAAFDDFNMRYAEICSEITELTGRFKKRNDPALSGLWIARNDARNYVILGDPAIQLPT